MGHNKVQLCKNIIKVVKAGIKEKKGNAKFEVVCVTGM